MRAHYSPVRVLIISRFLELVHLGGSQIRSNPLEKLLSCVFVLWVKISLYLEVRSPQDASPLTEATYRSEPPSHLLF